MRMINRVVGISGVSSGSNANIPLPVGRRYHTLKLKTTLAGVAAAAGSVIDMIRVKVNESTIWELSAAQLLKFNTAIGLPDTDGILTLHFSRPDLADIINEEATAFDMFGESSFRVEAVIKAVADPGIEAVAYFDTKPNVNPATGQAAKMILRLFTYTESFPLGTKDWTTLNKTRPILRTFLDSAGAGVISQVDVIADDITVFESKVLENVSMLKDYGIVGGTHKFPVVFNFTNRLDDGLLVAKSLNFKVTSSAAQDITAVMETLSLGFGN